MRRNLFTLQHFWSTSARQGELMPVMLQETVPGDTWGGALNGLIRVNYPLTPIMHKIVVRVHLFYIPPGS